MKALLTYSPPPKVNKICISIKRLPLNVHHTHPKKTRLPLMKLRSRLETTRKPLILLCNRQGDSRISRRLICIPHPKQYTGLTNSDAYYAISLIKGYEPTVDKDEIVGLLMTLSKMWAEFYIEKPTDILENLIRHCST